MKCEYIQPDGKLLTAKFRMRRNFDPWQSQVHVIAPTDGRVSDARRRRTFHVAHRGNYDWMIGTRFAGAEPYRMTSGSGEILVYASANPAATQGLLLWRGPYHEVQSYLPNALAADGRMAVERIIDLHFEDRAEGLVIRPPDLSGETILVQESFTYVPGVASLNFHSAANGLGFVPSWSGAKVAAGELWRSQDPDQPEHLVLASSEAVCVVSPAEGRSSRLPECLKLAQSIDSISLR